jgi:hypothetical protein
MTRKVLRTVGTVPESRGSTRFERVEPRAQEARPPLVRPSLAGDLAHIGIATLLTLMEMERKTGVLSFREPGGASARIFVREGRIVHARLDGAPGPVDAECVYYLLTWSAGVFELVVCNIKGADRVRVATVNLLLEGARRLDEASYKAAI